MAQYIKNMSVYVGCSMRGPRATTKPKPRADTQKGTENNKKGEAKKRMVHTSAEVDACMGAF